ncbi:MAG TPA: amidohydrolase [Pararhizobium sp.]|nr:amidohydrolase [Pararhizobium sp.]
MRIIDTHLHLIYLERFSYPWLSNAPAINRNFHLEDYWAIAERLGIEKAIHMEVDVAEKDIEAESAFVTGLGAPVVAAISNCRPESTGFAAHLERAAANPKIKGFRRILHESPDELSQSDLFAENVRRLAGHGLSFDLCVLARQLPVGQSLVDRCPDVQFVLDHCGVPDIAGDAFAPWRDAIAEIARRPNIAAKISGVIAYAGANPTIEAIRPYVEHVIECFGWDRVVWGSDFPVCTTKADLESWVKMTRELIAGASESEKTLLLNANAERIYRL